MKTKTQRQAKATKFTDEEQQAFFASVEDNEEWATPLTPAQHETVRRYLATDGGIPQVVVLGALVVRRKIAMNDKVAAGVPTFVNRYITHRVGRLVWNVHEMRDGERCVWPTFYFETRDQMVDRILEQERRHA